MSLINEIFRKDNGISEEDLKNLSGKYYETSNLECKTVGEIHATSSNHKKDKYHYIIKTAIGLLNKPENDAAGLLIIGMKASKGIIETIEPIKSVDFKQDRLRNKLKEDIMSIPSTHTSYTLDVIEVPVNGGYVTLVEVHKTDPNAVFYSKSENKTYIRRGDSSDKWDLGDMFKVAMSKRYPIVYVNLGIQSEDMLNNDRSRYKVQAVLKNVGTSPGQDVVVLLKFYNPSKGRLNLQEFKDFEKYEAGAPYLIMLEKDVLKLNGKPIYPNLDLIIGHFTVTIAKDSSLRIDAITYESHGITTKIFELANGKMQSRDYNFIPYFR